MNCKPGDLARIVRAFSFPEIVGQYVVCKHVIRHSDGAPVWAIDEALPLGRWIHDDQLMPIKPGDGNEEFVTKLHEKLPRSKPATTKGDTITNRGELA